MESTDEARCTSVSEGGLVLLVVIGLAVGAVVGLTDPEPNTLPRRTWKWVSSWASQPPSSRVLPPASAGKTPTQAESDPEPVRLFTDAKFDDSGYAHAVAFSSPILKPTSLEAIRESVAGRGDRGIALLEKKLTGLSPSDPNLPRKRCELNMLIASLLMSEGRWNEAAERFVAAQKSDPRMDPLQRANLDGLRGLAALRRGEVENCVACCNEAS